MRGCVIELLLLLFISAGALICISPSILNKVFIGGMSCFIISYFLILSILIIYRMVRHLLNMKTANKIFLKVCEQGISLDDSSNVCFLSWQQIERIEIGGKKWQIICPGSYLYLYKNNGSVVIFSLTDYISGIEPSHLIKAIKYFSGRPNIIKRRNIFR